MSLLWAITNGLAAGTKSGFSNLGNWKQLAAFSQCNDLLDFSSMLENLISGIRFSRM
jgi:hypothetical protein